MRPRRSSTSTSATSSIPPELRENARRARGGTRAAGCPRSSSSATCAARCTATRRGPPTGTTRSRRWPRPRRAAATRYLCLTDHSHYLRGPRLEAQWKEIEAVNARLEPFRVLRGIEVNIRADGSLDVHDDDARRARLGRRLDPHGVRPEPDRAHPRRDRQPARRLHRPPDRPQDPQAARRRLDIERIVERAVETGTALEINSQPDRLDMRDTHARLAGEAGVLIPVTTDAHEVEALGTRSSASARHAARG